MSWLARFLSRAMASGREFRPDVFLIASFAAAAILVSVVAIPQWLSKQARWEVLRSHVGQIGQLAASTVDGDLHRQLLDPANYSDELYARALKPLVRFHSANSDLFYVYTMVDRGGIAYFVLDTATSSDLHTNHRLRASTYMQQFKLRKEYKDDWLEEIAAGKTYVTPTYQHDDYGYFLSAHVPLYDSKGRYSGFVGVDFDVQYYLAEEARFRVIEIGSLVAALIVALLIGFLLALYYGDLHRRMRELYYSAIGDDLTGLLNRRGAMDAVGKSLARHAASYATLLIDIDNLKMINDRHGHVTGDAVIACTAEAIRQSIREGDYCARLAGDEFLIFAPDCDTDGAAEIGRRIIARLSTQEKPLPSARFSVSIGIAVQDRAAADFDRMYRDADAALYYAKTKGKSRLALFAPFMAAAFQHRGTSA
ncbi:MAG: GGDEF domain-containing protein [Methyloceanibacter sp.]|jgi:diguanylate cyclase (GGDEF)-like protein